MTGVYFTVICESLDFLLAFNGLLDFSAILNEIKNKVRSIIDKDSSAERMVLLQDPAVIIACRARVS